MMWPFRILKLVCLAVIELAKQVLSCPGLVATSIRNWRREVEVDEAEEERLDRIRHPSKYLGKG